MIDDGVDEADADRRVIELVARGDVAALGELYDRHARGIFALALRIVADRADAEEVVQDVFTQVWRQSIRYDAARATVAGWLLMPARPRPLDRRRTRQSRPDTLTGDEGLRDAPAAAVDQESQAINFQRARTVQSALATLSDVLRTPIELGYYEGLSHSEIAQRLGAPLGTVKTRMRTALMKLRVVLDPGGQA